MKRLSRKERGFTLVEILIVLAVLAILAAVVVPNVTGFLSRGKERAWDADRRMLQAAVDAWRTDITVRVGNLWPTYDAVADSPSGISGVNSWIDIAALATGKYLKGANAVASATAAKNNSTNSPTGSYGWYIDANGVVLSDPVFSLTVGYP